MTHIMRQARAGASDPPPAAAQRRASGAAAAGRCAAARDLLHAHRRRAAQGPSIRAIDAAASRSAPEAAPAQRLHLPVPERQNEAYHAVASGRGPLRHLARQRLAEHPSLRGIQQHPSLTPQAKVHLDLAAAGQSSRSQRCSLLRRAPAGGLRLMK
jgi:hypothetical protein